MDLSTYESYTLIEKRPLYNMAKDEYLQPLDETSFFNSYAKVYETYSKHRLTHKYYFNSKSEIKQMNDFFDSQKGRLERLWVPTFRKDILPLNDLDSDDVLIDTPDISIGDWYGAGIQHVFILLNDGTYFAREIASYTSTTVVLDSDLGQAVNASDIISISFLINARLDIDEIEWEYIEFNDRQVLAATTMIYKEVR